MASSSDEAGRVVTAALTSAHVLPAEDAADFGKLFAKCHADFGQRTQLEWAKIAPPAVTHFDNLEELPASSAYLSELLNKVVILKLNGGLGSSMGVHRGPKSTIEVKAGLNFLDLTVRQVEYLNSRHGVDVPLVLMNSFRTHDATVRALSRYAQHHVTIHCFLQSAFPRLDRDTFAPLPLEPFSKSTEAAWTPGGHGDVFRALEKSGLLEKLLAAGKEILFISNVDNLGATLDLRILHSMLSRNVGFLMEVTERMRSDAQGGALVAYDGKLKLLEGGLVPADRAEDFKSLRNFGAWCTNNLWLNLKDLKIALANGTIDPPVLISERTIVFGSDGTRIPVLELETAAGAAIEFFPRAEAVRVSRSRFIPIKNTGAALPTSAFFVLRARNNSSDSPRARTHPVHSPQETSLLCRAACTRCGTARSSCRPRGPR
jgi:UTP--glucose-1-phosphate uridylyltransferase